MGYINYINVTSPDKNLQCRLGLSDWGGMRELPVYSLTYRGKKIIEPSPLYFQMADGITEHFRILRTETDSKDETWETAFGEDRFVRNRYNEITISLASKAGLEMDVVFRLFDSGLAFRYVFKSCKEKRSLEIIQERTHFCFGEDHFCFAGYRAQCLFERVRLSGVTGLCDRPTVVELSPGGPYAAIGEAALTDFARMKLSYIGGNTLVSALSGKPLYFFKEEAALRDADENILIKAIGDLPLATPWRVIAVGENSAALYMNRYIFQNLNDPCAIADTSFIKPGKAIREATLTTTGAKACVDFAYRRNLQYIEFDAGWYGPETDFNSDATFVSIDPKRYKGPLDLEASIAYARQKGIGVILYINQRAMMEQLDILLPLFAKLGVSGIKYGFVEVGSQRWTKWLHECIRKAADYGMVLSIHDEYRPTGNHRTYPNLLTCEGIFGDEEKQPASNTIAHIFSRLLCGPADNTVCYFDPRVDQYWSHAYQLAKALCIFSPLQFLYWYDRPAGSLDTEFLHRRLQAGEYDKIRNIISDEPELDFFDSLHTVWDETLVLDGDMGKHVTMARRKGGEWFIGVMNAEIERDFEIECGFLTEGAVYTAVMYSDNAALQTRTNVERTVFKLKKGDVIRCKVLPDNGLAIRAHEMKSLNPK